MRKLIAAAVVLWAVSGAWAAGGDPDNAAAPDQTSVSGKVAETMDSGGYTYVRVVKGGSSAWVAVRRIEVKVGDEISFLPGVLMPEFRSKKLDRTFKNIIFSDGPAGGARTAAESAPAPSVKANSDGFSGPHGKKVSAGVDLAPVKTSKAEGRGARTVAEVYAERAELDGKTARVRGKVVKYSESIMDRNWIHLQDGTGDPAKGTHDLVVTTKDKAEAGETVTVRGTVAKDKDFTMGYRYSVIVEKAELSR